MFVRHVKRICVLALPMLALLAGRQEARAQSCDAFCCQSHHCPPPLKHCLEGAPRICWKCGCPKPICNPCDQPNWGYYQTCWTPWPWPHNWSHCPVPPPAAMVSPGLPGLADPVVPNSQVLPGPRRLERPGF